MMMCPSSTDSTKNSSNNTSTTVGVKKTKKTPSKTTAKKRFSPKKYPKPTLEELALLVGSKPQKTQNIEPIEKPLPYELKWRENGAELCLYAANQTFIATQISRLQTHVVKPMALPALAQPVEIQPEAIIAETETTVEVPSSLNEYIPVEKPSVEQSVLEESYPKPTAFNELSALLGLSEVEAFENETPHPVEEEDHCPTSVELEFETPIEAQLAGYLGVKYASKTTISITDKSSSINTTSTQPLPKDNPLLPIEDYFSEALEAELAQQKAWLESALEREKNKAYPSNIPHPINKPATLIETVEEEAIEPQDSDAADTDTLLIQAEAEIGAEEIVAETEENLPSDNDQNFAAVLDSLMEDFSSEEEEPAVTEEVVEETLLDEPEEEIEAVIQSDSEVEAEIESEEPEAIEGFEVVGIYATETSTPAEEEKAVTEEPPASNQPEEITTFNQLLKITKPDTPMDFLLLGAYFLRQQEQKETFSLRQLNHLLSSVSKPNANHTVLELALAKHFITMMPDLTGTATATEYQLSKTGETAALRLFQTVPT
jgi:hypothetical protein